MPPRNSQRISFLLLAATAVAWSKSEFDFKRASADRRAGAISKESAEEQMNPLSSKDWRESPSAGDLEVSRRKALRKELYRWPDAVVPYEIHPSVDSISSTARLVILSAIDHWQKYTCVRFVPYEPGKYANYVTIRKGSWCSSMVGRQGGAQPLFVAEGCLKNGSIVHELGHSLGWVHEQARPDRDDYIDINWKLITTDQDRRQYDKMNESLIDTFGVPYDYGSIMHYNNSGGKIITRDPTQLKVIGQRVKLSFFDLKLANLMYKCAEKSKCDTSATKCLAEGYIASNCKCVCLDGTDSCTLNIAAKTTTSKPCSEWTAYKSYRKQGQSGVLATGLDAEQCKARCKAEKAFSCASVDFHEGAKLCYLNTAAKGNSNGDFAVAHYERNSLCVSPLPPAVLPLKFPRA